MWCCADVEERVSVGVELSGLVGVGRRDCGDDEDICGADEAGVVIVFFRRLCEAA